MSHSLPAPVSNWSPYSTVLFSQCSVRGTLSNKSHVISLLRTLQWLPVPIRIKVKVLSIIQRPYISDPTHLPNSHILLHSFHLCSAALTPCFFSDRPSTLKTGHLHWLFPLPPDLHVANGFTLFTSLLKCHLSNEANTNHCLKSLPSSMNPNPPLLYSTFSFFSQNLPFSNIK